MAGAKGITNRVNVPNISEHPKWALGTRPAALRAEPISRPGALKGQSVGGSITPGPKDNRSYGKGPGYYGQGNTAQTGET